MIERFDEIKKQLSELANVINAFKSEAVQLRIVDLIFGMPAKGEEKKTPESGVPETGQNGTAQRKRKRSRRVIAKNSVTPSSDSKSADTPKKSSSKTSGKPGPGALIDQLLAEGFFKTPKTANDIREHCKNKLAHNYSPSELSVSLIRAVRKQTMARETNDEGQYAYAAK